MPLLSATDLTKSYAGTPVLRGVSLALEPGEKVALVGRNGVGKTTLLRVLAGLEVPDGGTRAVSSSAVVGYLPQDPTVDEQPQRIYRHFRIPSDSRRQRAAWKRFGPGSA